MKSRNSRILGAALAALLPACGGGNGSSGGSAPATGGGTANPAFPVTMTEPAAGRTFTAPATITLSAVAADPASVAKVELLGGVTIQQFSNTGIIWSGGSVVATLAQPPFQATWTDVPAGIHTLVARVTDKAGALTCSNSVTITVLAPGESLSGWTPIARIPGGPTSFVDAKRGWTTATEGHNLHTVDGGATWVPQSSGTSKGLTEIKFVDAERGWAVGGDPRIGGGIVLRTTDGGASWTSSSLAISLPVTLSVVDADTAWVVEKGGHLGSGDSNLFATTDGGVTWTPLPMGTAYAVHFVDRQNGWVLGSVGGGPDTRSLILHTTDGGLTWSEQFRAGPEEVFMALDFVSATTGWVSRAQIGPTNKGILFTSDAGATWTLQTYPGTDAIIALDFVSPTQGWGLGFQGAIIHTEDRGASWVTQQSPVPGPVRTLQFVDANVGWAIGGPGLLFKTTTGGKAP